MKKVINETKVSRKELVTLINIWQHVFEGEYKQEVKSHGVNLREKLLNFFQNWKKPSSVRKVLTFANECLVGKKLVKQLVENIGSSLKIPKVLQFPKLKN